MDPNIEQPIPPLEHPDLPDNTVSSARSSSSTRTATENTNSTPQPDAPAISTEQSVSKNRVKQSEIIHGGEEKEIDIAPVVLDQLVKRLRDRVFVTNNLINEGNYKPSVVEEFLLNSPALKNLESGDISKEDLAVLWIAVRDELLQKMMASTSLLDEQLETTSKGLFRKTTQQEITSEIQDAGSVVTTDYTREISYNSMSLEYIENDLKELNNLRIELEQSIYGQPLTEVFYGDLALSLHPEGIKRSGQRLNDKVIDQLEKILVERHEGTPYHLLWQENPQAAQIALLEANERALPILASERAREILMKKTPDVDIDLIEQQAVNALQTSEVSPAVDTDLEKARRQYDIALAEYTTSGRADIDRELAVAEENLKTAKFKKDHAQKLLTDNSKTLNDTIERLAQEIADESAQRASNPTGTTREILSIQQGNDRINERIDGLRRTRKDLMAQLDKLNLDNADADLNFNIAQERVTQLSNQSEALGIPNKDTVEELRKAYEQIVFDRKIHPPDVGTSISPEQKEKAKGLRAWKTAIEHYGEIMSTRFESNIFGNELSLARLSSTQFVDGNIEGFERIRESIFRISDKAGYDPELARSILSDRRIAQGIFHILQLKEDVFTHLITEENQKYIDEMEEKIENGTITEEEKNRFDKFYPSLLLPLLNQNNFKAAELIRFLVHEGAKSAERGEDKLQISDFFWENLGRDIQREPMQQNSEEAETENTPDSEASIVRTGELIVDGRKFTYVGSTPLTPRGGGDSVPVTTKVTLDFNRDKIGLNVETQVDEKLMQILPAQIPDAGVFPDEIRKTFYDVDGKLRTDLRTLDKLLLLRKKYSRWIPLLKEDVYDHYDPTIARPREASEIIMSDRLPNILNETNNQQLTEGLTADIAAHYLILDPEVRKEELRGMVANIEAHSIITAEAITKSYQIRYDNGEFYISEMGSPDSTEILDYFDSREEQLKTALGVETLDESQRRMLDEEKRQIQSVIGREMVKAQQRR